MIKGFVQIDYRQIRKEKKAGSSWPWKLCSSEIFNHPHNQFCVPLIALSWINHCLYPNIKRSIEYLSLNNTLGNCLFPYLSFAMHFSAVTQAEIQPARGAQHLVLLAPTPRICSMGGFSHKPLVCLCRRLHQLCYTTVCFSAANNLLYGFS